MADVIGSLGLDVRDYERAANRVDVANRRMERSANQANGLFLKFGKTLTLFAIAQFARNSLKISEAMEAIGKPEDIRRIDNLNSRLEELTAKMKLIAAQSIVGLAMIFGYKPSDAPSAEADAARKKSTEDYNKAIQDRQTASIKKQYEEEKRGADAVSKSLFNLMTTRQKMASLKKQMDLNNRFIAAAKRMDLNADAATGAADNAELREERRSLFIERGLMSPEERREADRAARKAQRLSRRFDRTEGAAVDPAKPLGGITGKMEVTGEALTELKAINKNTENAANPPNH